MDNWTESDVEMVLDSDAVWSGEQYEQSNRVESMFEEIMSTGVTVLTRAALIALDDVGRLVPDGGEIVFGDEWGAADVDGNNNLFSDRDSAATYADEHEVPLLTRQVRTWASGARFIGAWEVVPAEEAGTEATEEDEVVETQPDQHLA